MNEANGFMDSNPQCLVIYNSQELINWWNGLTVEWKDILGAKCNLSLPITKEKIAPTYKSNKHNSCFLTGIFVRPNHY